MADSNVSHLVDNILAALEPAGEIETWVSECFDDPEAGPMLSEAFATTTDRLLATDPPRVGDWEHLLFAAAVHSSRSHGQHAYESCKAAIGRCHALVTSGAFDGAASDATVTIASGLTLVLSAERKLRQPIELAVAAVCDQYPDHFFEIAERCQDIWQRRGQMSGAEGLFVWDVRRDEWRLNQDFKPHRPADRG